MRRPAGSLKRGDLAQRVGDGGQVALRIAQLRDPRRGGDGQMNLGRTGPFTAAQEEGTSKSAVGDLSALNRWPN
jgi:hypothetical protein